MTTSEEIPTGTVLEPERRAGLVKFLGDSFDLHELRTLAFELGAGYQQLSHTHRDSLIQELTRFCERRNQFGSLIAEVRRQRPGHPFLALWSGQLPVVPRIKVQVAVVGGYQGAINLRDVTEGVSKLLGLPPDQVILMGAAGMLTAAAFVIASPIARLHDVPAPATPAPER